VTVRWDTSGFLRQLRLNGTPVPLRTPEYTFDTGLPAGIQTITLAGDGFVSLPVKRRFPGIGEIKIPDFLLQRVTSTVTIGVMALTPTPVIAPVVIEEFSVTPEQTTPGQVVTLKWRVSNATTIHIDAFGTVLPVDEATDRPQQTTRYTLTASNQGAAPVQKVITVLVVPPTPTPLPTATPLPTPTPPPPTPSG
jgi:hypothetical protein